MTNARRAVFLDRDGTLIIERDLVRTPADITFIPGAIEGLRLLSEADYALVIVTNQSARSRGLITDSDLERVHQALRATLEESSVTLTDVLHCPHHPTEGTPPLRTECACRKPAPGLLLRAAEQHGLDLASSWMVGDAARDIETGRRAGVRPLLVETGKGAKEASAFAPDMVVSDLKAAAKRILQEG